MRAYGVKEKVAVKEAVIEWTTLMMSYGHKPKLARHDSGSVELGREFIKACGQLGIETIRTPDGKPSYEIERMVQVIQDDIKTILQAAQGLGAKDWMNAVLYAVAIRNTITNEKSRKTDKSKSPAELITKKTTRVRSLQDIKLGGIVITKTPVGKRNNIMTRNQAARVKQVNMDPHDSAEVQVLGSDRLTIRGGLQPLQEEEEAWKSKNQREVTVREQNGITTIEVEQEPAATIIQHVNRQDEILTNRERAEQTGDKQEEGKEESQTSAQEDEEEMYWKVGDNYEDCLLYTSPSPRD